MKWLQTGVSITGIIFIAFLQSTLIAQLPVPYLYFPFILMVVIFLLVIYGPKTAVLTGLTLGYLTDSFLMQGFPKTTLLLLLTIFCLDIAFEVIFTNRSIYSLIMLGIIGNIIYDTASFMLLWWKRGEDWMEHLMVSEVIWQIFWHILFTTVMLSLGWIILNMLTKRFRSLFVTVQ